MANMRMLSTFNFKTRPYDHQINEFENIKDKEYHGLFWEMGTGKTKIALDKAVYLYQKGLIDALLISAPNGVHIDHVETAVPFHVGIPVYPGYWTTTQKKEQKFKLEQLLLPKSCLKILAVNPDSWRYKPGKNKKQSKALYYLKEFMLKNRCFLVVDESSDFKNYKSQRSQGLIILSKLAPYRMVMDGTPITQGPSDIYTPFHFLKPGLLGYNSFMAFQARYEVLINPKIEGQLCEIITPESSEKIYDLRKANVFPKYEDLKRILLPWELRKMSKIFTILRKTSTFKVGYRNIEELYQKIKPHSSRILKVDCLNLPSKIHMKLPYELNKDQRKYYSQLEDELRIKVDKEEMTVDNVLTLYLRLQMFLGGYWKPDGEELVEFSETNPRIELLIDSIKKIGPDHKIIIWARFVKEIEAISKRISQEFGKDSFVQYYGAISTEEKQEAKRRFKTDPDTRSLIGNTKSGGVGLDLPECSYMYFFNRDFSLRSNLQAVDRAHRIGQTKKLTIIDIVAPNTMDEHILAALGGKQSVADYITGDYMRMTA